MSQIGTHWQLTLATDPTFAAPVQDLETFNPLQFVEWIPLGLIPETDYLTRAALIDDIEGEGPFSDGVPFTTLAVNIEPEPPPITDWGPC